MDRRRRTDQLPPLEALPSDAVARALAACEAVTRAGFATALAIHVPDDGSRPAPCAASGRGDLMLDVACGIASAATRERRAMHVVESELRSGPGARRHAGFPVGRTGSGTVVLVVSDARLVRRDIQSLAVWIAPAGDELLFARSAPVAPIVAATAREFDADLVGIALFAASGMTLQLHVRSGALLDSSRIPADTVWGEVARHGAAYALGDLPNHAGARLLASLGMRSAALVGLENGNGIALGAIGVASRGDLPLDASHRLLAQAPQVGPELMARLSSTPVPVPDPDGSVDLHVLAARVGCRRFAMYERRDGDLQLVAAHAADGSRLMSPPDPIEAELVWRAASEGSGLATTGAAAVAIGGHSVLYAQDPVKPALDCLRRALHDVRHNPFGAPSTGEDEQAERDAA